MARLRRFLASMTGRLFVILLVGMLSAAIAAPPCWPRRTAARSSSSRT